MQDEQAFDFHAFGSAAAGLSALASAALFHGCGMLRDAEAAGEEQAAAEASVALALEAARRDGLRLRCNVDFAGAPFSFPRHCV